MSTADTETRYRDQREKNNAAARRSRAKAKSVQATETWLTGPDSPLTADEMLQALRFLDHQDAVLSPAAKDAVRKHLLARRAVERERIGELLARLDAMP